MNCAIIKQKIIILVFLNFKEAFQAIYDYEAQDNNEVSFRDGDLIINFVKIS